MAHLGLPSWVWRGWALNSALRLLHAPEAPRAHCARGSEFPGFWALAACPRPHSSVARSGGTVRNTRFRGFRPGLEPGAGGPEDLRQIWFQLMELTARGRVGEEAREWLGGTTLAGQEQEEASGGPGEAALWWWDENSRCKGPEVGAGSCAPGLHGGC